MRETTVRSNAMRERWRAIARKVPGRVLDVGLRGLSRVAMLHPQANPDRYGVVVTRDVPYGPDPIHRMDIYRPRTATGDAAPVIYLHGGGFRILSKDTHWGMALALAHRGHTVFVPDYRLAPAHPFPAAPEDACRATLWVVEHAREHGADPARLVLAGESAGANLSLVVAIARSWRRPEPFARAVFDADIALAGVLPACGFLQVSTPEHRGTVGWMLERMRQISHDYLPHAVSDEARELADVVTFLERAPAPLHPLPPMFAIVGGGDPVRRDTERLTPAWTRHGAEGAHKVYGDSHHAFHAFLWRPMAREAWADQHEFLDRVLAATKPEPRRATR